MNVCPSCGTLNPVSAKFCQECGTRLTPSESIDTAPSSIETDSSSPSTTIESASSDQASSNELDQPSDSARPKKDMSGLPPSWMPAPVSLSSRPSGQGQTQASPPPRPAVTTTPPPPPLVPVIEEPSEGIEAAEEAIEPNVNDVTGLPPSWMPPPVDLSSPRPLPRTGVDSDWKMSDAGPLPDRKDRRIWLWIPVGLIAAVLICCIAFFIWATTIGEDTVDGWATNAAVNQTEETTAGD